MRTITRRTRTVGACLAALAALLAPGRSPAQQFLGAEHGSFERAAPPVAVRNNARADTLERSAVALYGTPRRWQDVARLHERAAALRGDDPRAVDSWRMAAWAHSAAGNDGRARLMMERAAQAATAGGDVERAAGAYIDAALIARASGDAARVTEILRRTRTVVASPLLPPDRRSAILRRIGDESRLAQEWGTP